MRTFGQRALNVDSSTLRPCRVYKRNEKFNNNIAYFLRFNFLSKDLSVKKRRNGLNKPIDKNGRVIVNQSMLLKLMRSLDSDPPREKPPSFR